MSQNETSEIRTCISILDYKRLSKQADAQGLTVSQALSNFFEKFFADEVDSHLQQDNFEDHNTI